ncbi:hypothetical protein FA15DRAFT_760143 [Coprinopsis marcescibilis]|uniref:Uncharacterized protein n=1 Tax=Coprinopsis marcescibilis TaxID=230819 RepID=A0A5C3KGH5_COPMA|nr:hypothetical protein FA15DRAFT_760143 [Coprinopsis marcescibilis]
MSEQRTRYFQPYFLEDKSGRLTGSEFIDLYERIRLSYRCTRRPTNTVGAQFSILELSSPREDAYTNAVSVLDYQPGNALGTVYFGNRPQSMARYLRKVSDSGSSLHRKYISQDGNEYRWSYRTHEDHEWTCVDSSGSVVAFYHLKIAGEPHYESSSGCMLTVEENYGDYAFEFLTSCLIMRYIKEYDIQ